jgi:hypothetical protein
MNVVINISFQFRSDASDGTSFLHGRSIVPLTSLGTRLQHCRYYPIAYFYYIGRRGSLLPSCWLKWLISKFLAYTFVHGSHNNTLLLRFRIIA